MKKRALRLAEAVLEAPGELEQVVQVLKLLKKDLDRLQKRPRRGPGQLNTATAIRTAICGLT